MIYIVEDDDNIRQMVSYALQNSGYETAECEDAVSFWEQCQLMLPELILLDIMLPGEDGLSVLRKLRLNVATAQIPVIIISAKTTELDRVRGLDGGADDYLTKPFGILELISRVKAVLRRADKLPGKLISYKNITIDEEKREVTVAGQQCQLTFKEYELLNCLLRNHEIVLSREKLMDLVWGRDFAGESRTVDMHIKSLRQKLGSGGDLIRTVRNVGYKLE